MTLSNEEVRHGKERDGKFNGADGGVRLLRRESSRRQNIGAISGGAEKRSADGTADWLLLQHKSVHSGGASATRGRDEAIARDAEADGRNGKGLRVSIQSRGCDGAGNSGMGGKGEQVLPIFRFPHRSGK